MSTPIQQRASRAGSAGRLPRQAMSASVADHIRQLIFDGTLKAEQRVPQDDIAADLGVSRLPVREALIALETDGLVRSEPHRGAFVVPITGQDIEDHYEIYGRVQGMAAARALGRITAEQIEQLEAWHRQMCDSDDSELTNQLNWNFHALLTHSGGSTRIKSVLRQMSHNLPRELYVLQTASPEANLGHEQIIKALRGDDPSAVEQANIDHVRTEGAYVVGVLAQRGVLTL